MAFTSDVIFVRRSNIGGEYPLALMLMARLWLLLLVWLEPGSQYLSPTASCGVIVRLRSPVLPELCWEYFLYLESAGRL
jgi:hypothetical protein